jgi:mono/diheme cytochrome c family protein/plastocyanin
MKKETLARIIVTLVVTAAIAIPVAGRLGIAMANPASAQIFELHARMPENGGWSIEHFQVQTGQTLHLRLTSDDVVHSFAIGQSDRTPLQIQPGEVVDTTLKFDRPGKYTFYCTSWCGPNHWRMRGTIDVTGPEPSATAAPRPLFLQLNLDLDAPHPASVTPAAAPDAQQGAQIQSRLPAYTADAEGYWVTSPAQLWQRLRTEASLSDLSDADVWNAVAWTWQSRTSPEKIAAGQKLYATNCAACHGEAGQGDGVMVRSLPTMVPDSQEHMDHDGLVRPPDFTDPKNLLGASPALLEGKLIRGGMGTGMPSWGSILTREQIDALIGYLYTFALRTNDQP